MRLPTSSTLLGLLIPLTSALSLTLYLPTKPNPFLLPANTHATLSSAGKLLSAPLSSVNTFVFHDVSPDSYIADIHCPIEAFAPLRIDVSTEGGVQAWETYRGNEWDNKGEKKDVAEGSAGLGVEVRSTGGKNYYTERTKFNVLSILKNPMILMGLASMAMFIGMPYVINNMDPEMKAEFESRQKGGSMSAMMGGGGSSQAQSPLGNFDMASYLAGAPSKEAKEAKPQQGVRRS